MCLAYEGFLGHLNFYDLSLMCMIIWKKSTFHMFFELYFFIFYRKHDYMFVILSYIFLLVKFLKCKVIKSCSSSCCMYWTIWDGKGHSSLHNVKSWNVYFSSCWSTYLIVMFCFVEHWLNVSFFNFWVIIMYHVLVGKLLLSHKSKILLKFHSRTNVPQKGDINTPQKFNDLV